MPAKCCVPSTLLAAIGMRSGAKLVAESKRPPAVRPRDPALRLRILPHFRCGSNEQATRKVLQVSSIKRRELLPEGNHHTARIPGVPPRRDRQFLQSCG